MERFAATLSRWPASHEHQVVVVTATEGNADRMTAVNSKAMRSDEGRARVLVVSTHPVQYAAPQYRRLAADERVELTVLFLSMASVEGAVDEDFGMTVRWDVPLLEGFRWSYPPNRSPRPSVHRFFGLVNPGVWGFIRRAQADVVVLYGYRAASFWMAWAAARASRASVVWTTDATTLDQRNGRSWKKWLKGLVLPWVFRTGDATFVPSSRGRRFLLSLGLAHERVHVTPYAVDNDSFASRADLADSIETRRAWDLPKEAFTALFVGKLVEWKRPDDLMRAAAIVPDTCVVFAGEGVLRDRLTALAASLGISERVRFLGFVNQTELPAVYRAADVLVLPSAFEPFGLVVNEAFACETPAIASDACGCVEDLIVEGETGFSFPSGDVAALADRLRWIQDRGARERMAAGARARISEWGPEANLEASVAVFRELAARRRDLRTR
jgi:glycosyltransferase involved in cell wall biosynthesis